MVCFLTNLSILATPINVYQTVSVNQLESSRFSPSFPYALQWCKILLSWCVSSIKNSILGCFTKILSICKYVSLSSCPASAAFSWIVFSNYPSLWISWWTVEEKKTSPLVIWSTNFSMKGRGFSLFYPLVCLNNCK